MKPIVYVTCEPNGFNLTPAAEYGELVILLQHSQSLLAPVPTVRKLKEKLKDFSEEDYLLPVGDPVLMCTVAQIASEKTRGKVKFLKWDRIQKKYLVIPVDTSGAAS